MTTFRKDIFLHFLNRDSRQIYGLFGHFYNDKTHLHALRQAFNACLLICENNCVAPPGFLLECDLVRQVVRENAAIINSKLLVLPMREDSIGDFVDKKRSEYKGVSAGYGGVFDDDSVKFLVKNAKGVVRRKTAIGFNIAERWNTGPDEKNKIWNDVKGLVSAKSIEEVRGIPSQLLDSGVAVTWASISKLLPKEGKIHSRELRRCLQNIYFNLYIKEFRLVVIRGLPLMHDDFELPSPNPTYTFQYFSEFLDVLNIREMILNADGETILQLRNNSGFIRFIDTYYSFSKKINNIASMKLAVSENAKNIEFEWYSFSLDWGKCFSMSGSLFRYQKVSELSEALGAFSDALNLEYDLKVRDTEKNKKSSDENVCAVKVEYKMPKLVIFVAIEEELKVLVKELDLKRNANSPSAEGKVGNHNIHVLCGKNMGRVPAAVEVSRYLESRNQNLPSLILIVGLAGGFVEEGINAGNIISGQTVVDLASRKVVEAKDGGAETEFRRRDYNLNEKLYDYIQSDNFQFDDWANAARKDFDWPGDCFPNIKRGLISSLDEVVNSDEWRKTLLDACPKLLGVEMEAGGVCEAASGRNLTFGAHV